MIRGAALLLAALAAPLAAQAPGLPPPPSGAVAPADSLPKEPVRDFVNELGDPVSLGTVGVLGVYDHLRNHPESWGGGFGPLTQRIASRGGGHLVATSVRHGLAAALGRSTGYAPCACEGLDRKVAHVVVETFTDRDRTGRRVLSEPYLAGTLAGSLAPAAWHPEVSLRDGVVGSLLSVALTLGARLVLELVPAP